MSRATELRRPRPAALIGIGIDRRGFASCAKQMVRATVAAYQHSTLRGKSDRPFLRARSRTVRSVRCPLTQVGARPRLPCRHRDVPSQSASPSQRQPRTPATGLSSQLQDLNRDAQAKQSGQREGTESPKTTSAPASAATGRTTLRIFGSCNAISHGVEQSLPVDLRPMSAA
jgi:hypothetical protein